MTDISLDRERLTINFPGWERLMAGRARHCVARGAIDSVRVTEWTSEILGMRSGLVVSGWRKLGTFRHPNGTRRLVSMSRGLPLLRIRPRNRDLGGGFDELLISASNAAEIADELRVGTRS